MRNADFLNYLYNSNIDPNEKVIIQEAIENEDYNLMRIIIDENLEECKHELESLLLFQDLDLASKHLVNYKALLCMDNMIMENIC